MATERIVSPLIKGGCDEPHLERGKSTTDKAGVYEPGIHKSRVPKTADRSTHGSKAVGCVIGA